MEEMTCWFIWEMSIPLSGMLAMRAAEGNRNHQKRFVLLGHTQIQEQNGNPPHSYHLP